MKNLPVVSIVVPAYNEADNIGACLDSLTNQDYKGETEIVVVNNASTDDTSEIAKHYNVTLVNETKIGVARARSKGFIRAKGSIILSTDADSIVPRNWVSLYIMRFKDNGVQAVVGRFTYHDVSDLRQSLAAFFTPLAFRLDNLRGGHFSGCNFGVISDAYRASGGFNEDLTYGEDFVLTKRLRDKGFKIVTAPEIVVTTSARQFTQRPLKVFLNLMWLNLFYRPLLGYDKQSYETREA